jgi:signal transduction histidine kinase
MISVKDQGIGIDSDHISKIFSQFYRVSGSKEKTYPGLGMGLYIANEIVKRHGGLISVKSAKNKGSEFSFMLPLKNDKK